MSSVSSFLSNSPSFLLSPSSSQESFLLSEPEYKYKYNHDPEPPHKKLQSQFLIQAKENAELTPKKSQWKIPIFVILSTVIFLTIIRTSMAVVKRIRGNKNSRQKYSIAENNEFSDEKILVVLTYDRRFPSNVMNIARCIALMLIRAQYPNRVYIRVPHPLILWNADHDIVQSWETSVRRAITDELNYRIKITKHKFEFNSLFLQNNIRFEHSRDIWSYGSKNQYGNTGPWWKSATEDYVYAIHPDTDPSRYWDTGLIIAFFDAEMSTTYKTVLSPTLVRRERATDTSLLDWRMTFPRINDRGDTHGVHLRRMTFSTAIDIPQPSAVVCYDDLFGPLETIRELFNEVVRTKSKSNRRITYADLTTIVCKKQILPFCPIQALGQSPHGGFLADSTIIGSLENWRNMIIATGSKQRRCRWIDLSCGISWLASENEAIAKYGQSRLHHWPELKSVDIDVNTEDKTNENQKINLPPPQPVLNGEEDFQTTSSSFEPISLIPTQITQKANDTYEPSLRFITPRPFDVAIEEKNFSQNMVSEALTTISKTSPSFDAPSTASGIERTFTNENPEQSRTIMARSANIND